LLKARCVSCHNKPPLPGVPLSLTGYADLMQPSKSNPSLTTAQQAAQLVQGGSMPPGAPLMAAEAQPLIAWVQAGAQPTGCSGDGDAGAPPVSGAGDAGGSSGPVADASAFATASVCTSNKRWMSGDEGSELMHPGRGCISCHAMGAGLFMLEHGPAFSVAGTLFPSAHEPDECNGAAGSGAMVVIKGADGKMLTLTPNAVGNFFSLDRVAMPFTAEVHYQGRVRAMSTPQSSGDCNTCHTESGANGAPGRIMLP
jgi:hypothetical protein